MEHDFNQTYQQYSKLVFSVALHIVLNVQEAEEVVQEVFIRLSQNLSQVENPKYWLIRATANHCYNQYHRKKLFAKYLEQTVHRFKTVFFTITNKMVIEDQLQRILVRLNRKERTMLLLKYGQEYQYNEIAQLLQISEGTVKSTLARIKNKIEGNNF